MENHKIIFLQRKLCNQVDMDTQNHYEDQEQESKLYKTVKTIFKVLIFGASLLVWVLIFYVVIDTWEPSLFKQKLFTEKTEEVAASTENYQIWKIDVTTWMNYDGSICVSSVWYSPETGELSIGIKYNRRLIASEDESGNTVYDDVVYSLTDQDENEFTAVRVETKTSGRYNYIRVVYSGVSLPLDSEDVQMKLDLNLSLKSTGEPLSTYREAGETVNDAVLTIYDKDTVCEKTDFS